jgi:hypothetical protein
MQYLFSKLLLTKLVDSKELFRERDVGLETTGSQFDAHDDHIYYCSDVIHGLPT